MQGLWFAPPMYSHKAFKFIAGGTRGEELGPHDRATGQTSDAPPLRTRPVRVGWGWGQYFWQPVREEQKRICFGAIFPNNFMFAEDKQAGAQVGLSAF